ncbi:MAG: hypothetical protein ACM3XS_08025 [Bacteroidota bacterium]
MEDIRRARAARRLPAGGGRLACDEDAVRFVDEKGFVLLMPLRGLPLPSLSEADGADPWGEDFRCTDRAWAWKETLPARKLCAYGKFIRARGAFLSWRLYPAFYAAYGPAGDPDEEYEAGKLARADRALVDLVAAHGPVDSHDLWRLAKPLFGGERHRFTAALDRLQAGFFLTVAGGTLEGWSRHTWDLVERQVPAGLLDRLPQPRVARATIVRQTVWNCAALPERSLGGILRWGPAEVGRALEDLLAAGHLARVTVEGERGPWVAAGWE